MAAGGIVSHVVVGTTVGSLKEVEGRVPLLRQELQVCFEPWSTMLACSQAA